MQREDEPWRGAECYYWKYIEAMTEIKTKRAYETPATSDGYRILVDRLWPRGLTHERLDCQYWAKDIAPSTELREWFHADPESRWEGFETRYRDELKENAQFEEFLKMVKEHKVVTLVFASKDVSHNEATVLKELCSELVNVK